MASAQLGQLDLTFDPAKTLTTAQFLNTQAIQVPCDEMVLYFARERRDRKELFHSFKLEPSVLGWQRMPAQDVPRSLLLQYPENKVFYRTTLDKSLCTSPLTIRSGSAKGRFYIEPVAMATARQRSPSLGKDSLVVKFVGSGNLQQAISTSGPVEANTGLGVLYNRWFAEPRLAQNLEFDLSINVASTADSIIGEFEDGELHNRDRFGRYILLPSNAKQAASFDLRLYFDPNRAGVFKYVNGLLFQFVGSNSNWRYDTLTTSAFGLSLKLGVFHDFMPDDTRRTKDYSIIVGPLFSYRGIKGDVSADQNSELRGKIMATDVRDFIGPEFLIRARFQNIRAEVQVPMINSTAYSVNGLTNVQFITSIAFVGGFPLELKGK